MTYKQYICNLIENYPIGKPIYINILSDNVAEKFSIEKTAAIAAVSVAVKRICDQKLVPELCIYQKGIYYKTKATPFGTVKIDKNQLIYDKYIANDNGYETGYSLLHKMGLTTQMPANKVIATNRVKKYQRIDRKLNVIVCPPKTTITAENKEYLKLLDIFNLISSAPLDADKPDKILTDYIKTNNIDCAKLLVLADRYYNKRTICQIAHSLNQGWLA